MPYIHQNYWMHVLGGRHPRLAYGAFTLSEMHKCAFRCRCQTFYCSFPHQIELKCLTFSCVQIFCWVLMWHCKINVRPNFFLQKQVNTISQYLYIERLVIFFIFSYQQISSFLKQLSNSLFFFKIKCYSNKK